MKKIKILQILVYIVFGLFIMQNFAFDAYRGFVDGYNDSDPDLLQSDNTPNKKAPFGPALITVLDGNAISGMKGDSLKVGRDYLLRNVTVSSDVIVNNGGAKTPYWLKISNVLLILFIVIILFKIASFINNVMLNIFKGTMFEIKCIKLIRKIGIYIIVYSVAYYVYEWLDYTRQTILIHAPLKVVNTVSFSFGALLCAMFVFIIAEAFNQGAQLKEEQELTI